ncbi:MAG: hypothetical protein PHE00_04810 [Atribacterota bacterium]|nr:hypothetical protein [Atribacterota bacterium]
MKSTSLSQSKEIRRKNTSNIPIFNYSIPEPYTHNNNLYLKKRTINEKHFYIYSILENYIPNDVLH